MVAYECDTNVQWEVVVQFLTRKSLPVLIIQDIA